MTEAQVACPTCHDTFPPSLATFTSETDDGTVYFCSITCKQSFDAATGET